MEHENTIRILVDQSADGCLLGSYLRKNLGFSKSQISSLKFKINGLMVNGSAARVNRVLHAGDWLEVRLNDDGQASGHLIAAEGDLRILYEDQDLIAVWKEAGQVLHPSHGHYQDTLSNLLHGYFLRKGENVMIRSIGRLDRDTQGIVVFAKNKVSAARLWEQKEDGRFRKEYLAVCEGVFTEASSETWQSVDTPLEKSPDHLNKMQIAAGTGGLSAYTCYQVIRQEKEKALVRVRIRTGRTHQIRVHMASIGHPLSGDILYGSEQKNSCMYLCAWKAELFQPFSGERIQISKNKKTS